MQCMRCAYFYVRKFECVYVLGFPGSVKTIILFGRKCIYQVIRRNENLSTIFNIVLNNVLFVFVYCKNVNIKRRPLNTAMQTKMILTTSLTYSYMDTIY